MQPDARCLSGVRRFGSTALPTSLRTWTAEQTHAEIRLGRFTRGARSRKSASTSSAQTAKLDPRAQLIEMDDLNMSETAYLNVPDRDKSPSPADSLNSSVSDLSTMPMTSSRRRDYGVSTFLAETRALDAAHLHFPP